MSDSTSGVDLTAEAELAQLRLELAKAQAEAAAARLKAAEAEIARKAAERTKPAIPAAPPAAPLAGKSQHAPQSPSRPPQLPVNGQHTKTPAKPAAKAPAKAAEKNTEKNTEKTFQSRRRAEPAKLPPPARVSSSGPLADEATAETVLTATQSKSPRPNSSPAAPPTQQVGEVPSAPQANVADAPTLEQPPALPEAKIPSGATSQPAPTLKTAAPAESTSVPAVLVNKPITPTTQKRHQSAVPRPTPRDAKAPPLAGPPKLPASGGATRTETSATHTEDAAGKETTEKEADKPTPASRQAAASGSLVDEEVNLPSYRSLARMVGSSLISGIIHVGLLILLGLWYADVIIREEPEIVSVPIPQETITEVLDTRITPSEADVAAVTAVEAASAGVASPLSVSTETKLDQEAVENAEPAFFSPGELAQIAGMGGTEAIKELTKDFKGDPSAVVDSIDEALDRLTHEILMMLQKGDVVVVWLFDESESMKDDRKEIRDRINRVYAELGLKEEAKAGHLAGAVVSFGSQWHVHTQVPTTDTDALMKAIGGVKDDDSGNEMLCQSVQTSIEFYKEYARKTRRQMAVVLVTDESGDPNTNQTHLELAIQSAKDARARIYGIGREAVFGYPYAYMAWTDPSTQITYWLQIDRGPETPGVEALQTNGLWRRWDAHPSGFGPYEQTRMCRESGGIFFMLPSPETLLVGRDDRKYELAKMRPYLPSLERRDVYDNEISKSRLRSTVKKVIYDLNPWKIPQIDLRQDFTIEGPALRDEIVQELGKIKQYVLYLDAAEQAMKVAETERQNAEVYPRWQANYDLIYAQILAYKVRLYQYGAFLQSFLEQPRPPALRPPANVLATATSTNWQIITIERLLPTNYWPLEEQEKYIAEATRRFNAVIQDHEGTPWAARAQWELSRGFGVDFVQEWDDPRRGQGVKLPKY